jgi:hypothetical protein
MENHICRWVVDYIQKLMYQGDLYEIIHYRCEHDSCCETKTEGDPR